MNLLAFLIVGFSGSNAALLPANFLDNPDLLFPSSPLLDSPLPGSLSLNQPAPGNEPSPFSLDLNVFGSKDNPTSSSPLLDSSLPGSLSLNQPAPGNDPSPFSLDLNVFDSTNNPTSIYSLKLAQQPNENGSGDRGEFSTVTPSIIYAETQAQTDDSEPLAQVPSTPADGKNACQKQSRLLKGYLRPYSFCCLGPMQKISPHKDIGLAPRQEPKEIIIWNNCGLQGPSCSLAPTHNVCCKIVSVLPDSSDRHSTSWRWKYKGEDCADLVA